MELIADFIMCGTLFVFLAPLAIKLGRLMGHHKEAKKYYSKSLILRVMK